MRLCAIAVLAILCLGFAGARANPIIVDRILVDFDPPNYQHRIDPMPGQQVDAYVVVDLSMSYIQEMRSVSFALSVTPAMAGNPVFTNLLDHAVGDWRTGITLSTEDCIDAFPAVVGRLTFVYLGVPGDVQILDHPTRPRWIEGCDAGTLVIYCVYSPGGVGKAPLAGDCNVNPVENVGWGAIKALYAR
jgi:hypothetical protein